MLEDLGFVEVVQFKIHVPFNQWVPDPELRKLADMTQKTMVSNALRPISMATLGAGLGWSPSRIDALLAELYKDLANLDFHVYAPV